MSQSVRPNEEEREIIEDKGNENRVKYRKVGANPTAKEIEFARVGSRGV